MRSAERLTTHTGLGVVVDETRESDHPELYDAFCAVVAADEGYPQHPDQPLSYEAFAAYWLTPATLSVVARVAEDGTFAGAYTVKPNGVGRAAHVANAGYFVVPALRGKGIGQALVEHSFGEARRHEFDALQFNFVFEPNPARRLYERLGFSVVGRVPDVIDGDAVYIYWRPL
jgi:GNAT superfamily N-acetyltransferase